MSTLGSEVNDLDRRFPGEMIIDPGSHQYHLSPQTHQTTPRNHQNATGASVTWKPCGSSDQYGQPLPMHYTQSNDVSTFEDQGSSIYHPQQDISLGILYGNSPAPKTIPIVSQDISDIIRVEDLRRAFNSEMVDQYHQYLTPDALSNYINIYWTTFHIQYPILHEPTIAITCKAHLGLFVAMITIGMSLAGDKMAHELAIRIHEELQWRIYSSKSFRYPAKLWQMQTLMLWEIFGKMFSGHHQHEMAHTFHGVLITMMRRGTTLDGFMDRKDHLNLNITTGDKHELMRKWQNFVEQECTKRVAFLALIIDSQHSMMFGHAIGLHAQELNLELPCSDEVWTARSAREWERARRCHNPHGSITKPGFIDLLSIFTSEPNQAKEKVSPLDPFGTFITLHGLISVGWNQRQTLLGIRIFLEIAVVILLDTANSQSDMVSQAGSTREWDGWKVGMERALYAWRSSTFEQYASNRSTIEDKLPSLVLFRIAHITLHTSVIDLQVLAGIGKVMGKPVTRGTKYGVLIRTMKEWVNSDGAVKSVRHALKLLSETVFANPFYISTSAQACDLMNHRLQWVEDTLDGIFHGKWCLYLATLTLWAWGALTSLWRRGSANGNSGYGQNIKTEGGLYESNEIGKDNQIAWNDAESYLKTMLAISAENKGESLMTTPWRLETRGLIIVIRNLLHSERWELLREGSELLTNILSDHSFIATANFEQMLQEW